MSYLPEWKGSIEGYVVNFLKKNAWRIAATHTYDEAKQEAYVVFLRCTSKYPMLDTGEHFMALFKTTLANEFTDLALKATVARTAVSEAMLSSDEEEYSLDVVGDLDNMGALRVMIRQAPAEVVMVLNLFMNAPQELLELAMEVWRRSGKYRADGDKAVSRMLGLPPGSTPMSDTHDYFSS